MTLAAWPGTGIQWPFLTEGVYGLLQFQFATIDATGEKQAIVGRMKWADRGTHDVRTIGWRAQNIVSAGGSGITVSLQDVDAATGNPSRPDGTQDQTKDVLLSALSANAWNSQTLTADRTVAHNAPLAVVWEFDGAGRLGADSLVFIGVFTTGNDTRSSGGAIAVEFIASWAQVSQSYPVLVLTAADGTIGTLGFSLPWTAINTHTFNSGSTPDERANQFVLSHPATLEGVSLIMEVPNGADVSLILYEGTTAVETLAIDEDVGPVTATKQLYHFGLATPRNLVAGTTYRIAVQPNTATSITVHSFDVSDASHLALFGGTDMHYWDRVDAGAWANETLTRCLVMKLHFSKTDDGTGGAGGGLKLAGRGGLAG